MEGFARFIATERIVEGSLGRAEILGIDRALRTVVTTTAVTGGIGHLAEAEAQLGTALALGREADPSGSILCQVNDSRLTGMQGKAVLSLQLLHHIDGTEGLAVGLRALVNLNSLRIAAQPLHSHDGRPLKGTYLTLEIVAYGCGEPSRIVILGGKLSVFQTRVVGLTVIDITLTQGTVGIAQPGQVGRNDLLTAVLQFHLQQGTEGIGFVAVHTVNDGTVPPAR